MTRKTDEAFATIHKAFEQVQGRMRESLKREDHHRAEAHSTDPISVIGGIFARLRECLAIGDGEGVQQVIFDLSAVHNGWTAVPDAIVEGLLTLLRSKEMYQSELAGNVLNYFPQWSHQKRPSRVTSKPAIAI